jgi:hypothetical protein
MQITAGTIPLPIAVQTSDILEAGSFGWQQHAKTPAKQTSSRIIGGALSLWRNGSSTWLTISPVKNPRNGAGSSRTTLRDGSKMAQSLFLEKDTPVDFLYLDRQRISSLIGQLSDRGMLIGLKLVLGKSEGKEGTASGSIAFAKAEGKAS